MSLTPAQLPTLKAAILAGVAALSFGASAQSLTSAQLTTLRSNILASELSAKCAPFGDGPFDIAAAYNLKASPSFVVRRSRVQTDEIGPVLNYVAVANLTTANRDRATTFIMLNPGSFSPTADVETYWSDTFGGTLGGQGQATRDALAVLWRREATRFERVFATGTGTSVAPGALVVEGTLSPAVVAQACQ